jgi:Tfp pilus assembly protein PilN
MNKFHGITAVSDGTYVQVTAAKKPDGWHLTTKTSREIADILRNSLQFTKLLNLGIECHWVRILPDDSESLVTSSESSYLSPCIHNAQLTMHKQLLEKNLGGCYPDDAFLCTLPLHMSKSVPPDSFITIFKDESVFKIGIVTNKKLSAVFSLPSLMFAQLSGFLERIRRYWSDISKGNAFPSHVFTFNNQDISPGNQFTLQTIRLPVTAASEIKAFGLALCPLEPVVPSLCGATKSSDFRFVRTTVYAISALIVLMALLFTGYMYYDVYSSEKAVKKCESDYKNILNKNIDIRTLTQAGESLAKKLLRVEKFAATPTYWSRFFELIGSIRPKALYFDRMASEQKMDNSDAVRIAITGWADSETTVTDFIQKLNKPDYVSNVTLSTLERDIKVNKIRFKILCNVTLLGN